MTLLSVVQDACDKLGIPRLSTVIGSSSPDARLMLVLANQENEEQLRRTAWQNMTEVKLFNAVGTANQDSALLQDVRFIINETFYNRTRQRVVQGPLSPQEWQRMMATTTQIYFDQYRIRQNVLLLWPVPTAGDEYAFEYITKSWATDSTGDITRQIGYEDDADLTKLNPFAVTLGIVWRWKLVKGLDYAEDFRTYEIAIANLINRDGSKRTISMAGPSFVSGLAVQEGSWPL